MNKDFYKVLGVSEDASPDEIKKTFRRLAKKYHPDRHQGDKAAEAKFKELSEAYDTLGDAKKREEYDTMRKYGAFAGGPQGGFDPRSFMRSGPGGSQTFSFTGSGDLGGLEEILRAFMGGGPRSGGRRPNPFDQEPRGFGAEDIFGGRRATQVQRGADLTTTVTISFREMVTGTVKVLRPAGGGKKLRVRIPAGIQDGGKVRLKGQGQSGLYGGRHGDLIITVRVMPDQEFERKGNDVYSSIEISFIEAIKGCKKNVKTLNRTVALTIPPGTQPGTQMRLKGMGLGVGGVNGDQYVEIKVTIPDAKDLTENQKRLLDEWEQA
jgi:molecular chaperone DnaJ